MRNGFGVVSRGKLVSQYGVQNVFSGFIGKRNHDCIIGGCFCMIIFVMYNSKSCYNH